MTVLFIIFAYFIGAIPFGVIFARMKGVNLLESGSRNTGATNAFRCAGPVVGILTGVADILKGFLVVWVADLVLDHTLSIYLIGIAAIFGHTKSIFLRFKGGKAIATSFGVFLYINTIPVLLTLGVWVISLIFSRMISFASIMAGIALPIITLFYSPDWLIFLISLIIGAYVILRHKENIQRILSGTESRIGQRKNRNLK